MEKAKENNGFEPLIYEGKDIKIKEGDVLEVKIPYLDRDIYRLKIKDKNGSYKWVEVAANLVASGKVSVEAEGYLLWDNEELLAK